jgi:hypothetical protein
VPNADRQHPHDFFMELGALYERAISRSLAWSIYVAPSGEPAAGPVAFMHRPSAMNDPMSNISHHWQDATHITFGVVTGALYGKRWKLEGSAFNGREPDENRWDFDLGPPLSSYSGRFTVNPSNRLSLSGSLAHIDGHDPAMPDESMRRGTASVLYSRAFGRAGQLATAAVWGANRHDGESNWEHSALAEVNLSPDARNTIFSRVEYVRKSRHDLGLDDTSVHDGYPLTGVTLGYVREVGTIGVLGFGLGARGTATWVPETLRSVYDSRAPLGLVLFVRARPKPMTAEELAEMHERMKHAAMGM